jgi:signal peptidase II
MGKNKRQLKNIIINPEFQLKLVFYFFSVSLAILGVMILILNIYITDLHKILSNVDHISINDLELALASLNKILYVSIVFVLAALGTTVVFTTIISHRIAGPMFAIVKYIEQMLAGDYDNKRILRPSDELHPIMEKLHELSDQLKKKKS